MNRFVICANCQRLRSLDHMAKSGRCIYCPSANAPRLLAPPAPLPVVRHPAIREETDALSVFLRKRAAE